MKILYLVSNTAGSQGNLISAALQWNPTASYYNADGSFVNREMVHRIRWLLLKGYNDMAHVNTYLGNIGHSTRS